MANEIFILWYIVPTLVILLILYIMFFATKNPESCFSKILQKLSPGCYDTCCNYQTPAQNTRRSPPRALAHPNHSTPLPNARQFVIADIDPPSYKQVTEKKEEKLPSYTEYLYNKFFSSNSVEKRASV